MLEQFKNHVESQFEFLKGSKLILAISGGIDSVVLAHLFQTLRFDIALAHCNFKLRGKESDADEDFVLELGEDLGVEVFIQNFDTDAYAKNQKTSIQMAARELRYEWFSDLAEQLNYDFILTAHHADDNLETFLINFTRGTGLNGLTGIPILNNNIARPLLPFSREQIEAYAKAHSIKWREDRSNKSRKYLRNKLRHDVVPILKEINPQLLDSFQNTLEHLNDTADIVDESLNAVAKRAIVDIDENGVSYKVSEFKKVNNPKAYLFGMFKDFGFSAWNDVVDLLDAETGKFVSSSTHRLTKHREFLILSDANISELSHAPINIFWEHRSIKTPIGLLSFQEVDDINEISRTTIYVNKTQLKYPLELRLWRSGDTFQPSGMAGKKKVSKYLKDEKLGPVEKQNTWVLVSDGKIVWVIGRRADERFKVESNTQHVLKIEHKK